MLHKHVKIIKKYNPQLYNKIANMKNKLGFNLVFAIIAFPIGLALLRDINFESFTFKKPAIDIFYLIVFFALLFFMLKKKKNETDK